VMVSYSVGYMGSGSEYTKVSVRVCLSVDIKSTRFDSTYTIWDKHGESLPPPPPPPPPLQPPSPEYDNMAAFLDKIIRPDNESTQTTGPQPTQTTSPQPTQTTGPHIDNEFEALFSRATDKLYPGCTWMTSLDFLAKMLHAKEIEKMQNYPICNASGWKDLKTKRKKVANKVVRYFPLIPRLQRLYKSQHTAKRITWHSTGKSKENSQMNHPVDDFFYVDDVNSNPKSPTKDIDVFFQPLIRELQTLWSGVWTGDVVIGTDFKMKAVLLSTINDFPARSSLFGWSGVLPRRVQGKHLSNKQKPRDLNGEFNWNKGSIFYNLEYWHTLQLKRNLDVMHIEKNALERLLGGPVYMRRMYPFERYMKKLKDYVRNKAKPEGSIAKGYVAEEALTFCSHYLKGVEIRFNCLDINGFGLNPTDTFQILQKSVENNPQCSPESELFSLACRPHSNANLYAACIVNGVKFLVHDRDIHRTTQSSRVATPGPNGEMFYGQLEEILELTYIDVALSANLSDLDYTSLSTNDESTKVDASPDNEVPDEESADFIGDEDDVVPHVLEDDDQDDDVRDDDDPASVHVVSSEDEN
nr:hypothetical protein [Tanacetum cinerariifolium]